MEVVQPTFGSEGFHCPHCGVFAHQTWHSIIAKEEQKAPDVTLSGNVHSRERELRGAMEVPATQQISCWGSYVIYSYIVKCAKCGKASVWANRRMVYPRTSTAPFPNDDLPEQIKEIHAEARAIFDASPRAAAALIRLCLEMLCNHVGAEGKDLNSKIGNLHARGLHQDIVDLLDVGRLIGNSAVHPGEIDLTNTKEETLILFDVLNLIANKLLTEEAKIAAATSRLTDEQREQFKLRRAQAEGKIKKDEVKP